MPRYNFQCDKCNKVVEKFIPAETVNKDSDWNKLQCEKCDTFMYIVFDPIHAPGVIWKGAPPTGKAIQQQHMADKQLEVYNEGFTCKNEVKESMEMAKEEEIKRGKTPGTLTTGVEAPTTKDQTDKARKKAIKKMEESRKGRGCKRPI